MAGNGGRQHGGVTITVAEGATSASTLVTGVQALAHKLSPLISTIGNMLG